MEALDNLLERTKLGHGRSEEHWNCFKSSCGETTYRRGGAYVGISERIDTLLTELKSILQQ